MVEDSERWKEYLQAVSQCFGSVFVKEFGVGPASGQWFTVSSALYACSPRARFLVLRIHDFMLPLQIWLTSLGGR